MGAVGHSTEYNAKERKVYWKIKKFNGGTEQTLRTKVIYNNIIYRIVCCGAHG